MPHFDFDGVLIIRSYSCNQRLKRTAAVAAYLENKFVKVEKSFCLLFGQCRKLAYSILILKLEFSFGMHGQMSEFN